MDEPLNGIQLKALSMRFMGQKWIAIAQALGENRQRVYEWSQTEAWKREWDLLAKESREQTVQIVRNGVYDAAVILHQMMRGIGDPICNSDGTPKKKRNGEIRREPVPYNVRAQIALTFLKYDGFENQRMDPVATAPKSPTREEVLADLRSLAETDPDLFREAGILK